MAAIALRLKPRWGHRMSCLAWHKPPTQSPLSRWWSVKLWLQTHTDYGSCLCWCIPFLGACRAYSLFLSWSFWVRMRWVSAKSHSNVGGLGLSGLLFTGLARAICDQCVNAVYAMFCSCVWIAWHGHNVLLVLPIWALLGYSSDAISGRIDLQLSPNIGGCVQANSSMWVSHCFGHHCGVDNDGLHAAVLHRTCALPSNNGCCL